MARKIDDEDLIGAWICPMCEREVAVRLTKQQRACHHCDFCGYTGFGNRKFSTERLKQLVAEYEKEH